MLRGISRTFFGLGKGVRGGGPLFGCYINSLLRHTHKHWWGCQLGTWAQLMATSQKGPRPGSLRGASLRFCVFGHPSSSQNPCQGKQAFQPLPYPPNPPCFLLLAGKCIYVHPDIIVISFYLHMYLHICIHLCVCVTHKRTEVR